MKNSENSNYIFSYEDDAEDGERKICSTECLGDKINYGEDKKCVKGCLDFQKNKIINEEDNYCVDKCNYNLDYKYENEKNEDGTTKYYCSKRCPEEAKSYSKKIINVGKVQIS